MVACIFFGIILTALTVSIHSLGTAYWIVRLKRPKKTSSPLAARMLPLRLLCSTALLLLTLHILEVIPWALVYLSVPDNEAISTFEESAYFAMVTFSSLGYGDIVISGPWRLLSAIQAMNGLLIFGWSTALLFAVVERIWGDGPRAQPAPLQAKPTERPVDNASDILSRFA